MSKLSSAPIGSGHDCALKGVTVQTNIEAPKYWWPEWQRYHFADIIASQSQMHCIEKFNLDLLCPRVDPRLLAISKEYVLRFQAKEIDIDTLLANLPQGVELTARITTNYLQLKTMYAQRKEHRQQTWKMLCAWMEELEYSHWITGKKP